MNTRGILTALAVGMLLLAGCSTKYNVDFKPPAGGAELSKIFPEEIHGKKAQVKKTGHGRYEALYQGLGTIVALELESPQKAFESATIRKRLSGGKTERNVDYSFFIGKDSYDVSNSSSLMGNNTKVFATFQADNQRYVVWNIDRFLFWIVTDSEAMEQVFVKAFDFIEIKEKKKE